MAWHLYDRGKKEVNYPGYEPAEVKDGDDKVWFPECHDGETIVAYAGNDSDGGQLFPIEPNLYVTMGIIPVLNVDKPAEVFAS